MPAWVRRVDVLIVLVGTLGLLLMELTDGFSVHLFGYRISARRTSRLLLALVFLVVVRHLLWRRPSLVAHLAERGWVAREPAWDVAAMPFNLREALAVVAFFVVVVGAAVRAQLSSPFSVPDYGDPLFSTWRLAWVARAVFRDPLNLFDANIFHPEPGTLAYSDSMIVPSLLAAPLFWAGVPHLLVYQVVFLTAFVASGVTLYFFVSRLTGSRAAGLVSGTIFALYPYRFEHYSHLELQITAWLPVSLLLIHRLVRTGDVNTGAALGVAMSLQMLSCMYYGMFGWLYLVVLFAVLTLVSGIRPIRARIQAVLVACVVAAVPAAALARPYLDQRVRLGERGEEANRLFSAAPSDYLKPHARSATYGRLLETGPAERALFPGVAPVVLAGVALVPPVSTAAAAYGVALLASFDASLGFNAELYPALYRAFLPFRGLRVPARFSILVGLSLAVLSGLAVARIARRLSPRTTTMLASLLILLVFMEYRPTLELQPVWRTLPPVYAPLLDRDSVLAVFPMGKEVSDTDARYMYFSTWHWQRLANGYSGNFPRTYVELLAEMRQFPQQSAVDYLQRRGVQHVVLHGEFAEEMGGLGGYDEAVRMLDATRGLELVGVFPAQPRPSRLYRLRGRAE